MSHTGKLCSVVKAVLRFAEFSNPRSVHRYNAESYRRIDELSISELLDRLRDILAECSDRVVGDMYHRGVFSGMWVCIGVAVRVLRRRGTANLAVVRSLVDTYTNHLSAEAALLREESLMCEAADDCERGLGFDMEAALLGDEGLLCEAVDICERGLGLDIPTSLGGQTANQAADLPETAVVSPAAYCTVDGVVDAVPECSRDPESSDTDGSTTHFSEDSPQFDPQPGTSTGQYGGTSRTRNHQDTIDDPNTDDDDEDDRESTNSSVEADYESESTESTETAGEDDYTASSETSFDEDQRPPSTSSNFILVEDVVRFYPRFKLTGREMSIKFKTPPEGANPIAWLEESVSEIFDYTMRGAVESGDYVGFSFNAPSFSHGSAGLSFRPASACHRDDLWRLIFNVTQSSTEFVIDQTFMLTASRVNVPVGRGGKAKALTHEGVKKKSILAIPADNLCLPRALVVARAYVTRGESATDRSGTTEFWSDMRRANSRVQYDAAKRLCSAAGVVVPDEGCGMGEIARFQEHLALEGLVIRVYDFNTLGRGGDHLYNGETVVTACGQAIKHKLNILYLPRRNHFKTILNIVAAAGNRQFCEPCNYSYRHHGRHSCSHKCPACKCAPACEISPFVEATGYGRIWCNECRRFFQDQECFRKHKLQGSYSPRRSVCKVLQICAGCAKMVNRTRPAHNCGFVWCITCGSSQPVNHECFMKPLEGKNKRAPYIFIFYDFETQQSESLEADATVNLHVPNLCVAQQACTACIDEPDIRTPCPECGPVREFIFRVNPVEQLVEFVTRDISRFQKIICIAHNARGFDSQFILRHLVERDRTPPRVILNGTKIVMMETGHTRFLDSLAYMPMALAALPKAFGLPDDVSKGVFPHLFNRPENQGYVGPLPSQHYYDVDTMTVKNRERFDEWYEQSLRENHVFDFARELIAYCRLDVDILRRACSVYRKIFLDCGDVCPFTESTTIASACNTLFRKNFLKPKTIGVLPRGGYRMACNQSRKAIKWLVCLEFELGVELMHAGRGREFKIPQTGRPVDGYLEDGKRVFEFQGCYWHGCPKCYRINRDVPLVTGGTMDSRLEETVAKQREMTGFGYTVTVEWECSFDYRWTGRVMGNDVALREHIDNHPLIRALDTGVLNPRDAFFGGRTGNTHRFYEAAAGERIRYLDVCSLYPYVCKTARYPVGHPKVYVGDECCVMTGPGNSDISRVEGIIKCTILPPRDLYHPVLPIHMRGKLMCPLCRTCCEESVQTACPHDREEDRWLAGTWISVELKKAVALGYKIIRVAELWHYSETSEYDPVAREGGLFTRYINTFLKLKQEASGWPSDCVDEVSRARYLAEYERIEGIRLDPSKIVTNPGMRQVAKLCLNSFWGKFGQRENLPQTDIIRTRQRLMELMVGPDTLVTDILPVTNDVLYARWQHKDESVMPSPLTNVVLAAYTTAHARLKLYGYLERLGRRVLYYDTDSVIYVSRGEPGEHEPEVGNFLGQLTDELEPDFGAGSYIRSFVSGGPKFYSFIVCRGDGLGEAEVCKIKGITLNCGTRSIINFEAIRVMVVNAAEPILVERRAIRRTALHQVVTLDEKKKCKPVQTKRRCCVDSYDTLPFGYV